MKKKTISKTSVITILLFFGILYLPTLVFPFVKDKIAIDDSENRVLATAPELKIDTIMEYPKQFDRYYNDNLPFRSVIRGMWNDLNIFGMHDSTSDKVLLGKSNAGLENIWLFYKATSDGNPVRSVQGYSEYSEKELEKLREKIDNTTSSLKKKGIEYYVLIAPNKENVYREFLPDGVSIVSEDGKADKLIGYLWQNGVKNLIYPKQELVDGKSIAQTYYKQDTHWNDWGGFVGFSEYMKVAESKYKVKKADVVVDREQVNKDLVRMLGLKGFFYDNVPKVSYLDDLKYEEEKIKTRTDIIITNNETAPIRKSVLFVGDSFRNALLDYFAKTYKKCVFMHREDYKTGMTDKYQSDVVISESVERYAELGIGWKF